MASSWDDMLDEFRALGGTAENICLRDGAFGRGLFPIDPAKPVALRIPDPLLVEVKHITFGDDDVFRLRPEAPVGARERAFLEAYQRDFSWGVNRGQTREMLEMMAAAPEELRALLKTPFNTDLWLGGPTKEAVRERYFSARYINYKGRGSVMPIVELANHGHAATYKRDDGIGISGRFDGEILVRYCFSDALELFNNWGFASEDQPFALSLQIGIENEHGEFIIERRDISLEPNRKPFFPDVKVEGKRITLSHMLLGHKNYPRLAKGNFYRILRDAGRRSAEETFDRIVHINRAQFLKLIAASEGAAPPLGGMLRNVARIQLEAMSYAIGTREV